jgi:hypothetical protein
MNNINQIELISHRGNIYGVSREEENSLLYVEQAIKQGFSVEVDIWKIRSDLYFGHDCSRYLVSLEFLQKYEDKLYLHCKNHDVFEYFYKSPFEIFWHIDEDFCITTKGKIWAKPNSCKLKNRIEVQLKYEKNFEMQDLLGICSDEIGLYKKDIQ